MDAKTLESQREHHGRREKILEVSLSLFLKKGFEGAPISAISGEVGTSKANIYYHFRSKEGLLHALLEPLFEEVEKLLERHRPASQTGPPQRDLLLEECFDLVLDHREAVSLLTNDAGVLSHPQIGDRARELNGRLLVLLAGQGASMEERFRAACALRVSQTAVGWSFDQDPETVRRMGLATATEVLEGGS